MGVARVVELHPPFRAALLLFVLAWVWGQVVGHAALPLLRHSYAEDGGELARLGALAAAGAARSPPRSAQRRLGDDPADRPPRGGRPPGADR